MMRRIRYIWILPLILAILIGVPETMAYFSTYVETKSGKPVRLNETIPSFKEELDGINKHLTLSPGENSDPIFVRVKVIVIDSLKDRVSYQIPEGYEGKWETRNDDGYLYYKEVLKVGDKAELDVIVDVTDLEIDEFNVIVIYEYVPGVKEGDTWKDYWDNSQNITVVGQEVGTEG